MHEAVKLRQPTDSLHALFSRGRLTWWPEIGIGWYPVEAGIEPYDQEYFDRFGRDAQTPLGRALMTARVDFVDRHYTGTLVDVGIGSGAFIEQRESSKDWDYSNCHLNPVTYGYDVNPAGIKWLEDNERFWDPYDRALPFDAMSLWDVLEHIPDYPSLLASVRKWLFVSLPIFRDAEHVLRSKHYRPTEHVWYYTHDGLVFAMKQCGFALASESTVETDLGREDIGTFAFRRETV